MTGGIVFCRGNKYVMLSGAKGLRTTYISNLYLLRRFFGKASA